VALFEPIFDALNRRGVRYVVVGGVGVVLHGFARLTGDLDLIVDLQPPAAREAVAALLELGLRPRLPVEALEFADPDIRDAWVRDRGMRVFSFVDPDNPMRLVDVFASHPIPFDGLWERGEDMLSGATRIRVASIADLIALKRLAGRPQDLADIEALEEIRRRKEGRRG
jgi:hypothetical protein